MSEIQAGPSIKNIQMLEGNAKNAPFNIGVYPNSENISPPVKKEKTRVVEQATRTQVNIDLLKKWHDKQNEILDGIEHMRIRAFFNKQQIEQGAILDIEV